VNEEPGSHCSMPGRNMCHEGEETKATYCRGANEEWCGNLGTHYSCDSAGKCGDCRWDKRELSMEKKGAEGIGRSSESPTHGRERETGEGSESFRCS